MELLAIYFLKLLTYNYKKARKTRRKNMLKLKIYRNAKNVGVVHTHTHTHTSTFREIKRVANEATLYCVENRMTVVLYEKK